MKTRILLGMLLLSSLLLSCDNNEDEKFDPIKLKIESTDLTTVDDDEYMIPSTGGKFTIYSIDKRNISCALTYVEEGGIICQPESNGLFDDKSSYSEQWGKIIISSAVMPENTISPFIQIPRTRNARSGSGSTASDMIVGL